MTRPSKSTPFAKKSLGQNFLTDPNYIRKVVAAVDPQPDDSIIEIGPGRGALTELLVESGANVIAIELDKDLAQVLLERFSETLNFRVIEKNVLDMDFREADVETSPVISEGKLVANLPYYISTAILQQLVDQRESFSEIVLMFQREVVDRITASPGKSDRGYLTVIAEAAFEIEKLFNVPPAAFSPRPKVSSAVVRLTPKPRSVFDTEKARNLISAAFSQKRKTVTNNLRTVYPYFKTALNKANIDPQRRAETLSLLEWERLAEFIERAQE